MLGEEERKEEKQQDTRQQSRRSTTSTVLQNLQHPGPHLPPGRAAHVDEKVESRYDSC